MLALYLATITVKEIKVRRAAPSGNWLRRRWNWQRRKVLCRTTYWKVHALLLLVLGILARELSEPLSLGRQTLRQPCSPTLKSQVGPSHFAAYIILYDPLGNWPRYTRSLQSYYRDVKTYKKNEVPGRLHAFRDLVVSRGFASLPEAQAYVEGAQCRWPKEPFGN